MFRASSYPLPGATTTVVAAFGLPSALGDSSALSYGPVGLPDHDQQLAPDDGNEDARNMLSSNKMTSIKLENLLRLVG
jgi:hypothetical protein